MAPFVFKNKPINRFKEIKNEKSVEQDKSKRLIELKARINSIENSETHIKKAHDSIDLLIKKGPISVDSLQAQLRNIMWRYCGVVKDE